MKRPLALILGLAVLSGCGSEPTLDATDDATARASVNRMVAGLSPVDQKQFTKAALRLAMRNVLPAHLAKDDRPASAWKPLHGLTARQIIARAQAERPTP